MHILPEGVSNVNTVRVDVGSATRATTQTGQWYTGYLNNSTPFVTHLTRKLGMQMSSRMCFINCPEAF